MTVNRTKSRLNLCLIIIVAWGLWLLASTGSGLQGITGGTVKPSPCGCPTLEFPPRDVDGDDSNRIARETAKAFVLNHSLTFMPEEVLDFHLENIGRLERQGIPGMILECGVAKAGSSIAFASAKDPKRCLHLFDTFEGIPKPSERDGTDVIERYDVIQADKERCKLGKPECNKNYYGNMENLMEYDQQQFVLAGYPPQGHHVYFHKGLFDDTVWPSEPVAYAHLDGDWYDSTLNMLERISPYLVEGGSFVLDDVYYWSGAKQAFIDFFDIDFDWLQSEAPGKECVTAKDTEAYRLVLGIRASAERISENNNLQMTCRKKPEIEAVPVAEEDLVDNDEPEWR